MFLVNRLLQVDDGDRHERQLLGGEIVDLDFLLLGVEFQPLANLGHGAGFLGVDRQLEDRGRQHVVHRIPGVHGTVMDHGDFLLVLVEGDDPALFDLAVLVLVASCQGQGHGEGGRGEQYVFDVHQSLL